MRARLFMILSVVFILIGYLTYQQHQGGPGEEPLIVAEGVRATSETVMEGQGQLYIWNHGDRLAYYSSGTVGLVAPRGKGQTLYRSKERSFVDGLGSYVITRDATGIHITSRTGSLTVPNSSGEDSSFFHRWHQGLLYYTLSSRSNPGPSFGGLYAYNLATGERKELIKASAGFLGWGFDFSPDVTKIVLVMEDHRDLAKTEVPQVLWIHDLIKQETKEVSVLPPPVGYARDRALHGRPYWITPSTMAIAIYEATGGEQVGIAFYRMAGETLVLRHSFQGAIRLLEDSRGGQHFLVMREQVLAQNGRDTQYALWKYDVNEGHAGRIIDFPVGKQVSLMLLNEEDGRLMVALAPAPETKDKGSVVVRRVGMDGKSSPFFSARGNLTAAVWVRDTLYVTTLESERYLLHRISLLGR